MSAFFEILVYAILLTTALLGVSAYWLADNNLPLFAQLILLPFFNWGAMACVHFAFNASLQLLKTLNKNAMHSFSEGSSQSIQQKIYGYGK